MLEFRSVAAGYPTNARQSIAPIFSDLSFHLGDGECLAVVGTSGSGKSTILRLIAGLLQPVSGAIIRGLGDPPSLWVSPQSPVLIDFRTAMQNACLGREVAATVQPGDLSEARVCLAGLGLDNAMHKTPGELSGGMRRRVALAQALVASRRLTLLDEPFAELDGIARQLAETAIHNRRRVDASTMLVTHDLDSVCALCDRALVLAGPPTMKVATVQISPAITALAGPAARRSSPTFPDAVAQLQKFVVELT